MVMLTSQIAFGMNETAQIDNVLMHTWYLDGQSDEKLRGMKRRIVKFIRLDIVASWPIPAVTLRRISL
ncbi:hypothetical protein PRIPAC_76993 [Pristionchus pacificus]|uniref:Uncharacterized protein n=1 Tax=Pristionchus pacificus TaxID=54126 RepID=A0A2A6CQ46_PRIPA|nr:hypothetical protein PRIPAC_76993 [Pristionchus pacificus]|eukprot:PDM80177.1 hypothetical protein PRIPAC_32756 [Pristionchus pacificus]